MPSRRPTCSITPQELMAVLGGLVGLSLFIAMAFWSVGAVWILPFSMLEVLVLAVAFVCHVRALGGDEKTKIYSIHSK